jgi:CRISPR/Cas system-associated exonuclease Cas4 (RecB family)
LDYLEFNGTEAIPVDIKTGHCYQDPISDHHLAQLIFQAILVEKNFKVPVMRVKVIYTKEKSERIYTFSVVDKLKILIPETRSLSDILWTELNKEVVQNCSKVRIYSVSFA